MAFAIALDAIFVILSSAMLPRAILQLAHEPEQTVIVPGCIIWIASSLVVSPQLHVCFL